MPYFRAYNRKYKQGRETSSSPTTTKGRYYMKIQDLTIGQAVDYYSTSIAIGVGPTWEHGHIVAIDNHPYCPTVSIDATMYDYRPETQVVELHKIRPANTECTSVASCHSPSAYAYRNNSQ